MPPPLRLAPPFLGFSYLLETHEPIHSPPSLSLHYLSLTCYICLSILDFLAMFASIGPIDLLITNRIFISRTIMCFSISLK